MTDDIRTMRAGADDATDLAAFLLRQDVRPAPSGDDIALLCGKDGGAVWCVRRDGSVQAVLSCMTDGPVVHLAHFGALPQHEDLLARALLATLERHARDLAAALVAARVTKGSQAHRCLERAGFEAQWEEDDRDGSRAFTTVDLVKPL